MRGRLSVTYKPHSLCMGQCIEFQKTGQTLFVGASIGRPFFVWCCRGDHRSPENRIHFGGDSASASFLPPLRHFVPPLLKERLLKRPLRGAVVKRLRGGEQQFNIKKAVIH